MGLEGFGAATLELKTAHVSSKSAGVIRCYIQKLLGGFGVLPRESWNKGRRKLPSTCRKNKSVRKASSSFERISKISAFNKHLCAK